MSRQAYFVAVLVAVKLSDAKLRLLLDGSHFLAPWLGADGVLNTCGSARAEGQVPALVGESLDLSRE